ncbi:MAG: tRNA dihydrouridine(20/20a) synthase DusA [Deltaproteobacteria bacterium]|nr:MAG: tRNA dihydrouridine(20/20a) synthase DusA [Deltaproteobacteria bacterium]
MTRGFPPPLSVAPMMDRTDTHFRWVLRQITGHTLLYTEMVTTGALLRGPRDRLLEYEPEEHPIAIQLGGDDPGALAECAAIAEEAGFDEVNLNVGCPSNRVQSGSFGAALMARPAHVATCVAAMRAACAIPVTVKHRIGIDDMDDYEHMRRFVDIVADAGCDRFTVHARKAWLQGLSPKQNRTIPPLRHDEVWRLKRQRPQLSVEINGGITSLDEAARHLRHVDAVMIGRAAWDDPWMLHDADARFFEPAAGTAVTREEVVRRAAARAAARLADGRSDRLGPMARPLLNLFAGRPGARRWRRFLSEHAFQPGADAQVLLDALTVMNATSRRESA